ncbi:hypothetical protein YB2330_004184 [Saitoella coloradoensis]
MATTARKQSSNTAEIQTKLDHSAAAVRKLVSSWLPEESDNKSPKVNGDEDDESLLVPRPARLGLGASSAEINKNTPMDATAKLKRKLLGRQPPPSTQSARYVLTQTKAKPTATQKDESSDDEEESRGSIGKKRKAAPAPVEEKADDNSDSEPEEKKGGNKKGGFSFDSYKQEKSKKAKKRKRNKQATAAASKHQ